MWIRLRAVGRGEPDVARRIDDRCCTAHPDTALVVARSGSGLEREHRATRLGDTEDPAVVFPTIVETGVRDDDAAVRRCEPAALQLQQGLRARWVGTLVEFDFPVEEVEAVEAMLGSERGPFLHGHDEDLVVGEIDVGRPGDADEGRHDARAREVGNRTRRAEVGAPQDAPSLGREGVDGVVRGGDHHCPSATSGSPKMPPSSVGDHHPGLSGVRSVFTGSTPVHRRFWWYTGQFVPKGGCRPEDTVAAPAVAPAPSARAADTITLASNRRTRRASEQSRVLAGIRTARDGIPRVGPPLPSGQPMVP